VKLVINELSEEQMQAELAECAERFRKATEEAVIENA